MSYHRNPIKDEDARIHMIGLSVKPGRRVAFIVEDDGVKADRYIAKLKKSFPSIKVVSRHKGPTPGVVSVIITREIE